MRCRMDCRLAWNKQREGDYVEAAKEYESILNKYDLEDNKETIQVNLIKCLFRNDNQREVINKINEFKEQNKTTNKELVKEVSLIQGYAQIQLEDYNQAAKALSSVMAEYPQEQKNPETNFLVGYCYMKQKDLDKAREVFSLITKNYPESSYSNKASLCLSQIDTMLD